MGLCPRKPHTWSTFCCCCFIVYEEHLTWVIYILYSYSPCHNECSGEESLHEGKQTSCMTVTFHTYVECLRPYKETCQTSDLFAWFTAALLSDFSLPAAIPNFKRSSPGGACRSVVSGFLIVYLWSFFFLCFYCLSERVTTSLTSFSISCFQPGICNSTVLRPLPTEKVQTATLFSHS